MSVFESDTWTPKLDRVFFTPGTPVSSHKDQAITDMTTNGKDLN